MGHPRSCTCKWREAPRDGVFPDEPLLVEVCAPHQAWAEQIRRADRAKYDTRAEEELHRANEALGKLREAFAEVFGME